jgi:hypothetical protein
VVLVGCVAVLAAVWDRPYSGVRVEELAADLDARVPNGSTAEQAREWFDAHGIEYLTIADRKGFWAQVPNSSPRESAEIRVVVALGPDGRVQARGAQRFVLPR